MVSYTIPTPLNSLLSAVYFTSLSLPQTGSSRNGQDTTALAKKLWSPNKDNCLTKCILCQASHLLSRSHLQRHLRAVCSTRSVINEQQERTHQHSPKQTAGSVQHNSVLADVLLFKTTEKFIFQILLPDN